LFDRPTAEDTLPEGAAPHPPAGGTVRLHGLDFDVCGFSEQGPRAENQDAFTTDDFARSGLVAVADGMGGERGGRYAAELTLRTLLGEAPIRTPDAARRAVRTADHAVATAAAERPAERGGMGCALGLLSLAPTRADGPAWVGAHVGDVRILSRSPDGLVRLETRDHTPAFARWEAGEIELDEIPEAEGANRLQRAVGRGGEADVFWLPVRAGWSYLILSDGVTKTMRVEELGTAMAMASAAETCEAIRRKAAEREPDDNFTAVLVRVLGDAGRAAADPLPAAPRIAHAPPPSIPSSTGATAVIGARRSNTPLVLLAALSLVALAAAGFAFWTAREVREDVRAQHAAALEENARLAAEVDSLRAVVHQLAEPFGPTTTQPGDSAALRAPATPPAPTNRTP
jgi:protein phosphatase